MKIKRFTFNMFGVNTYVVWDPATRQAAIIDPGMINSAEERVLDHFITDNHLTVTHLINTHMHVDHSFGVAYVKRHYGVPLEAHVDDEFLSSKLPVQAKAFGIDSDVDAVEIDRPVRDGDTIKIGNEELKAIHVPGHSPGSLVLYSPGSNWMISGDVLFRNSIGRTDLAGGNHQQLIDGINTRLMTLPPETVVYPGHGPETTIGNEATYNPYL